MDLILPRAPIRCRLGGLYPLPVVLVGDNVAVIFDLSRSDFIFTRSSLAAAVSLDLLRAGVS